jgi:glycosyltransferase involved in cell wall biosynthesis
MHNSRPSPNSSPEPTTNRRVVFIANSMYSDILSGGDIHTLHMARGALDGGWPVHFFAGHGLKAQLEQRQFPVTLTPTDHGIIRPRNFDNLSGQLRLLVDYLGRMFRTLNHRSAISAQDWVYANTDFWWDSVPAMLSRARRKVMILGMDAPSLREIWVCSRPDVKPIRLPSVHYWLSQEIALRCFRRCRVKRLLYIHPNQKPRLLRLGFRDDELVFVSNGIDVEQADAVPDQPKQFDAVWTGRVHQQKGIDDLLATLRYLSQSVPNFRALLIGNLQKSLGPKIKEAGLEAFVTFSGFVSEPEKFRLLKCSRVFLMPSKYESWGIVIGEALASALPVIAYDLEAYRPIFGKLLRYVPPFDLPAFQKEARAQIELTRAGTNYLVPQDLAKFKLENSWGEAQRQFRRALTELEGHCREL